VKFLIDECLHHSLVALARWCGHGADHVTWVGLSGSKDWRLVRRAVTDDATFVTNNARDFRRLFAREPIHAGLVIILPNARPTEQQDLFLAVLDQLAADPDLVNQVLEVGRTTAGDIVLERYDLPPHASR